MALPFLEQDTTSGSNITSSLEVGSFTTTKDGWYIGSFSISSMNGAAATITVRLVHTSSADAEIRTFKYSESKDAAADTTYGGEFLPVLVRSGEKLKLELLSSNASDTAVDTIVDFGFADDLQNLQSIRRIVGSQ